MRVIETYVQDSKYRVEYWSEYYEDRTESYSQRYPKTLEEAKKLARVPF